MPNPHRMERIESHMQSELAKLLQTEMQDPRLKWVTLTGVSVSKDLSHAKIYFTLHDDTQTKAVLKALKHASKHLRYLLAQDMLLRKMPELHFYYDATIHTGARISQLLDDFSIE